ncbi:hypothetical protein BBJ28_00006122 [Nothophytophthora sp. Chile5]|nr:hypothetical protein BBJ28_00006122 [Nothophytophthora sp. Chile5]
MAKGVVEEPPVVARCVDQRQPQDGDPVCVERGREVAALRKRLGIRISAGNVVATTTITGSADTKRELEHWPAPLVDFVQSQGEMRLPAELVTNMTGNKFERPTPVQMQTIPCVLLGHNVLVSAPTGSGKTASYLIPVISQILATREQEESEASRSALVLAPIRELAMQIEGVAKLLMRGIPNMKTALLVGGFPVPTQRYRLQCGVQLIVATPGRFLDIFTNYAGGDAILEEIRTCVIDEVDVMLDVGFRSQISQIVALLSPVNEQRSQHGGVQILLFSATISDEVEMLVQQTLKIQSEQSYLRIEVGGNSSKALRDESSAAFPMNAGIQQRVRWTEDKAKKKELFTFLTEKHEESTVSGTVSWAEA